MDQSNDISVNVENSFKRMSFLDFTTTSEDAISVSTNTMTKTKDVPRTSPQLFSSSWKLLMTLVENKDDEIPMVAPVSPPFSTVQWKFSELGDVVTVATYLGPFPIAQDSYDVIPTGNNCIELSKGPLYRIVMSYDWESKRILILQDCSSTQEWSSTNNLLIGDTCQCVPVHPYRYLLFEKM